jgi:hypothetical protein
VGAQQRAPVPRGYVPGQTAGRSRGLPVHWPLCPAPLPPLVGGEGFAAAIGAAATESASVARTPAMTLRVLPIFLSFRSTFVRVDPCASNAPRDRPIAQGDLSHHAGAACGFASARCVGIQCDACRGGIAQRNRGSRNRQGDSRRKPEVYEERDDSSTQLRGTPSGFPPRTSSGGALRSLSPSARSGSGRVTIGHQPRSGAQIERNPPSSAAIHGARRCAANGAIPLYRADQPG